MNVLQLHALVKNLDDDAAADTSSTKWCAKRLTKKRQTRPSEGRIVQVKVREFHTERDESRQRDSAHHHRDHHKGRD